MVPWEGIDATLSDMADGDPFMKKLRPRPGILPGSAVLPCEVPVGWIREQSTLSEHPSTSRQLGEPRRLSPDTSHILLGFPACTHYAAHLG